MSLARTLSAFFAFGVVVVGVACSPFSGGACEENESCAGSGADAGTAGAEGDAGNPITLPSGCDLTKSIADAPACVSDEVGIFVSPSGDDDASGRKATPLKTIATAVALAASRSLPRVYVCEGTYDAPVEVKSAVSILGGLTCQWEPVANARPRITPPVGPALRVVGVTGGISFEDLDVTAGADANAPGASAIAAFVSESKSVAFRRVNLKAGAATDGPKGEARSNYTAEPTAGGNTSTVSPGAGPSCTCLDGTSSKGGMGSAGPGPGVGSGSSTPMVGSSNSGSYDVGSCTAGGPGANGNAAPEGTAQVAGVLSALGWDSSSVTSNNGNGSPGQGGGGGGAHTSQNVGGGGGGCGGCGGAGGTPGTNGGSSFALLSFNSGVTIEGGSLVTSTAGTGGEGAAGQNGQSGATYGYGACNGGSGGSGAGGNGGAGGAGGHSVPIGFVGPEPTVAGAALTPGAAGVGGAGGARGTGPGNAGSYGLAGPSGKSLPTLAL